MGTETRTSGLLPSTTAFGTTLRLSETETDTCKAAVTVAACKSPQTTTTTRSSPSLLAESIEVDLSHRSWRARTHSLNLTCALRVFNIAFWSALGKNGGD